MISLECFNLVIPVQSVCITKLTMDLVSEIPNRILTANLPTNAVNDYPLLSVHVSNTTVAMISSRKTETIEPTISRMATDMTTHQTISIITRSLLPSQQRLVTTELMQLHTVLTSSSSHIQDKVFLLYLCYIFPTISENVIACYPPCFIYCDNLSEHARLLIVIGRNS